LAIRGEVLWKKLDVSSHYVGMKRLSGLFSGVGGNFRAFKSAYLLGKSVFSTENGDYPQAVRLREWVGIDTLSKSQ
jgi:hypothetical protein